MRVLFFVGTLNAGGLERFVTNISLYAKSRNDFEPVICCLTERKGEFLPFLQKAGIKIFEAPQGWARSIKSLFKLAKIIKYISPDIVHSQGNFSLLQQLIAVKMKANVRFCVTERSTYQLKNWARLRRLIQFHLLRFSGANYSANGYAVARHLARQVKVSVGSIQVIPNCVSLIKYDPIMRLKMRNNLGWNDNDIVIGYISRMVLNKGHEEILKSVHILIENNLKVKLCFVGDGPERSNIEKLVGTLNLMKHVYFAGTVTNVEEYIQASDIISLLTTTREGMPNSILEGMAAGKTIVATAVGAVPELLNYGKAGILIDKITVKNITEALEKAISDSQLRVTLGNLALEYVKNHYSIDKCYTKLIQYYKKIYN